VTEDWLRRSTRPVRITHIDATVPNVARVWNYLVGGRDNFEADRWAARQLIASAPVMRDVGPASRAFLRRVVRHLADEAGIRQFLDIGTGIPTAGSTHEIAQAIDPCSRIVYVDNDPVVLAHARALLISSPEGVTSYIDADAREPGKIIASARLTLDFDRPVALVLMDILNFIDGTDEVAAILGTLLEAVPSGSYLAVTQTASDLDESVILAQQRWNQMAAVTPVLLRDRAEVTSWFDDLEMVEPGVVEIDKWRPAEDDPHCAGRMPVYGAVGRKRLGEGTRGGGRGQRAPCTRGAGRYHVAESGAGRRLSLRGQEQLRGGQEDRAGHDRGGPSRRHDRARDSRVPPARRALPGHRGRRQAVPRHRNRAGRVGQYA
jgi:hypothetical protein